MSDVSCSPSPSKKRKGRAVVISSDSSDVYLLFFSLRWQDPEKTSLRREEVKSTATPLKKRMRKTPPGSDSFNLLDAVTTTYVYV
jgi:hypothetical protein